MSGPAVSSCVFSVHVSPGASSLLPPPDLSEDLVPPRGLMVKEMTPTFGPRYAIGPGNTLAGLSYLQSHFQGCGEEKKKKGCSQTVGGAETNGG